jgi:ABC-type nitrate/sulfonate/bicarbonate transport system ATPase subunit
VYLGDRVVVLTQRPAKVKAVIDVDVPRDRTHPDFLALRKKIEDMIEASL